MKLRVLHVLDKHCTGELNTQPTPLIFLSHFKPRLGQTHDPIATASTILGLQVCALIPGFLTFND